MRAKTDEKRNAIIAAATAVFEEVGYRGASMAMIAARLGGSKATLYGYFHSKEQLFATAVTSALDEIGDEMLASLRADGDIVTVLTRFSRLYLDLITRPEILAIQRTVLSESQTTGLGREVYLLGPQRGIDALTDFFSERGGKGGNRRPPRLGSAPLYFKSLLEAGVSEPLLLWPRRDQGQERSRRDSRRRLHENLWQAVTGRRPLPDDRRVTTSARLSHSAEDGDRRHQGNMTATDAPRRGIPMGSIDEDSIHALVHGFYGKVMDDPGPRRHLRPRDRKTRVAGPPSTRCAPSGRRCCCGRAATRAGRCGRTSSSQASKTDISSAG